jgi:hypothetical protein
MIWEPGKDEDRRNGVGRRLEDRNTCSFHKIKCRAIEKNEIHIEQLFEKMATKDDVKEMKDLIKTKAPRWVVTLFITTSVIIFLTVIGWIGLRLEAIPKIEANQEILMDAFRIEPVPKK